MRSLSLRCKFTSRHYLHTVFKSCLLGLTWFTLEGWLGVVNSWSIEREPPSLRRVYNILIQSKVILQLRIYALYDCSRTIALVLIGGFLLRVGSIIAVLVFATMHISGMSPALNPVPAAHFQHLLTIYFCPPSHRDDTW